METDLNGLYNRWLDSERLHKRRKFEESDSNIAAAFKPGMRLLRLAPQVALISFILSSNNNLPRITSLYHKLAKTYGKPLCITVGMTVEGNPGSQQWYTEPSITAIASFSSESDLRDLGLGYRAKYLFKTCNMLLEDVKKFQKERVGETQEGPYTIPTGNCEDRPIGTYLLYFGNKHSSDRVNFLRRYPGVGRKVADCIGLMGLEWFDAVPVDVHMSRIASRVMKVESKRKTYDEVEYFFRKRYPDHPGWATTVLFAAEVRRQKE